MTITGVPGAIDVRRGSRTLGSRSRTVEQTRRGSEVALLRRAELAVVRHDRIERDVARQRRHVVTTGL